MIGKKVKCVATVGVTDNTRKKVCLLDVTGEFERDHCWIDDDKRMRDLKKGDTFSFTAIVYEYFGIDKDCKQIKKVGLMLPRNIKRIIKR